MRVPKHLTIWFAAVIAAVFLIASLRSPFLASDWFWAIGIGLGFASLACLFFLAFDVRMGSKVRAHQLVSYGAIGFLLAHVLWLLIGDPVTLEYSKLGAEWHMWSAWLALALLLVLIISSLPSIRQRLYTGAKPFRIWHRILTVAVFASALHHVLFTDFHITRRRQWLAMTLLALAALIFRMKRDPGIRSMPAWAMLAISIAFIGLFLLIGHWRT